jgi:LysW-gamma-L-lysine carboxypeptidase
MRIDHSPDETLIGLVHHFSPSGQERDAAAWLVERMAGLGFRQSFIDETGNAIGIVGKGPRKLVLLGHIDTVPGEIPVHLEDDLLYGRGTVDAKGPLAAFVEAAASTEEMDGWQLIVIGAVEEERESDGARAIAGCFHPEYAIVGEPNRWDRIALGYKGSARVRLSVHRNQTHTASPDKNACEAAIDSWLSIKSWADSYNKGRERVFDQLLLRLHGMESEENEFEQRAYMDIGARLPPNLSPENWYAILAEIVVGAETHPQGLPLPAHRCEKNTPLVRAMLSGIRSAGGTPGFVYKTGTSDLNVVGPVWKCPTLVYGPGNSSLDHTSEEHISLVEYRQSIQVLHAAIHQITG